MKRKKIGRPPKLGKHQPYMLRLPVELHRDLRRYATEQGVSLNDLLVGVIARWSERHIESNERD